MSQVGLINQAIRNAYEKIKDVPKEQPVSTGLLARTEKKKPKQKMNDAVRLLMLAQEKTNGRV